MELFINGLRSARNIEIDLYILYCIKKKRSMEYNFILELFLIFRVLVTPSQKPKPLPTISVRTDSMKLRPIICDRFWSDYFLDINNIIRIIWIWLIFILFFSHKTICLRFFFRSFICCFFPPLRREKISFSIVLHNHDLCKELLWVYITL